MNPETLTLEELIDWLYMLSKSQEGTLLTTVTDINVRDTNTGRVIVVSTLAEKHLNELVEELRS